jgi:hypothetical protein
MGAVDKFPNICEDFGVFMSICMDFCDDLGIYENFQVFARIFVKIFVRVQRGMTKCEKPY